MAELEYARANYAREDCGGELRKSKLCRSELRKIKLCKRRPRCGKGGAGGAARRRVMRGEPIRV